MYKIGIFIGEVFKIEVSDGLVHPLGNRQIVNLRPFRMFTGARVFMFCKCLEFKRITPMSEKNTILFGEVFQIEVSAGLVHPLGSRQNVNLCPTRVFTGHIFLGFCNRLEFKTITPMSVQNSIFEGEEFQIKVSGGLVCPLGSQQYVHLSPPKVFMWAQVFRVV